jgi:septal ring factor EnvC (AmiA/AmiB activator)
MRFYRIFALILLLSTTAQAQQPSQPSVVQQLMTNDATIKAALAEQLDAANKRLQELTVENVTLKKQVADAKAAADKAAAEKKKEPPQTVGPGPK